MYVLLSKKSKCRYLGLISVLHWVYIYVCVSIAALRHQGSSQSDSSGFVDSELPDSNVDGSSASKVNRQIVIIIIIICGLTVHLLQDEHRCITVKGNERKSIYIARFIMCIVSKRSDMHHTVLPANTPCLPFLRKRSPDGATPN